MIPITIVDPAVAIKRPPNSDANLAARNPQRPKSRRRYLTLRLLPAACNHPVMTASILRRARRLMTVRMSVAGRVIAPLACSYH